MSLLKEAIEDFLNRRSITVEAAADRHFSPTFCQRTNGAWDSRATVVERLAGLRAVTKQARVTVLDEFIEGRRYAERHLIELDHHEGGSVCMEVYVFGERDESGRFLRIEESALPLPTGRR